MRIDGLTLDLRERNAWEAFDLGVALARNTGWKLFLPFGVVFFTLAVVLHLIAFFAGLPTWAAVTALWWLKPAVDRVALAVLAQTVFGSAPPARQTLDTLTAIPRAGLLSALTYGRFDFARSFHLPVRQLEGQTGKDGRERLRVLDKKLRGHAFWLTLGVWHFVFVLVVGLNGLVGMLAPENVHASPFFFSFFRDTEESLVTQCFSSFAYVLSECVLEPFYVAAGFALYLSRRTALEGWDLEVAFKRMAARIDEQTRPAVLPAALALLLAGALTLASLFPTASYAQDSQSDDEPDSAATAQSDPVPPRTTPAQAAKEAAKEPSKEKTAIRQVLAAPDFNEFADEKVWHYTGKSNEPGKPPRFGEGFFHFMQFVGELLRGGLWVVAIVALAWLLYMLVTHFGWFKDNFRMQRLKPDVMFGLDLRPESLPDDVPGAARALLAAGNMRGALALLYRASLSVLVHERDVEISIGDTEGDCVRRVARVGPAPLAAYFEQLADAWSLIAYAGRKPETTAVTRLIDTWAGHFGAPKNIAQADGRPPEALPA
ncbi:MAG TPA: DUF4129 domain-containing protein [Burkholderiales bacterium]|nr:DUF4129 domain-containing protein [Burkholderiales bacterium]